MVNESNFIVRKSGRPEESYYIDYQGIYKINEIANISGLEAAVLRDKYTNNGGRLEAELDIYYFPSLDKAKSTITDILGTMKKSAKGRVLLFTEAEIEYIRMALINENSNTIHVGNKIKDQIFKKLNA